MRTTYRPPACPHLVAAAHLSGLKSSYFMWDEKRWHRVCKKYSYIDALQTDVGPILLRILLCRGLKDVEIAKRLGYDGVNTIYEARKAHKIPKNYRLAIRKKMRDLLCPKT